MYSVQTRRKDVTQHDIRFHSLRYQEGSYVRYGTGYKRLTWENQGLMNRAEVACCTIADVRRCGILFATLGQRHIYCLPPPPPFPLSLLFLSLIFSSRHRVVSIEATLVPCRRRPRRSRPARRRRERSAGSDPVGHLPYPIRLFSPDFPASAAADGPAAGAAAPLQLLLPRRQRRDPLFPQGTVSWR